MSYEDLQGDIDKRIKWALQAEEVVKQEFKEWRDCAQSLTNTFTMGFNDNVAGAGEYGKVTKTTIRKMPQFPVAVKQSFQQEIDEARRMVLVTSLVEAKYNPHFPILISHFHCETDKSRKRSVRIGYLKGVQDIQKLNQRREELAKQLKKKLTSRERTIVRKEYDDIPDRIDEIYRNSVPTIDEIKWISDIKGRFMREYQLSGDSPSMAEGILEENVLKEYRLVSNVFLHMLEKRKELAKANPYEIFVMEFIDNTMLTWVQRSHSVQQWFSCAFQVCAALISLQSYFGLVQNDLYLKNIMYNQVKEDVVYHYDMGEDANRKKVLYKVPLYGYLFKVIDFGLSTNVKHAPHCEDIGMTAKNGTCTPHNRDFIEFFNTLARISNRLPPSFADWVRLARDRFRQNLDKVKDVVTICNYLFSDVVLKKYGCPVTFATTEEPSDVFYLQASKSRRKSVIDLSLQKTWIENSKSS